MKNKRRFYPLSLLLILTVGTSAHSAELPDEQIQVTTESNAGRIPGDPLVKVIITDSQSTYFKPATFYSPALIGTKSPKTGEVFNEQNPYAKLCKSLRDPECAAFPSRFITAKYPYCSLKDPLICLKSFWAILPDGKRIEATFIKELDPGSPVRSVSEPVYGLPRTAGDSIFEFRDESGAVAIKHNGGSLFALRSSLTGYLGAGAYDFEGAVFAVSLRENASKQILFRGYAGANGGGYGYNWDTPVTTDCAVMGVGVCGVQFTLPTDIRFGVEMQSTIFPIKWSHGRLDSPVASTKLNGKIYSLSIEGKPTRIPAVSGSARFSQLTPTLQKRYPNAVESDLKSGTKGVITLDDLSPTQGDRSLAALKDWLEYLPDKAQALPTAWSIRTISVNDLNSAKFPTKCLNLDENFAGLVTTNATAYSSGPPRFDAATGTLEYQVAAPHFEKDGVTPFKGSYDLAIRSDVARCIYGFTSAPVQATISILSSGTEQKITSTTFKEENGWMNFSAKNFEFSSPKLMLKLTQNSPTEQVQTPAPKQSATAAAPAASPSRSAVKTSSITCSKGKLIKKISGISPKCPKGYAKKSIK
jgi:hypothetical protein